MNRVLVAASLVLFSLGCGKPDMSKENSSDSAKRFTVGDLVLSPASENSSRLQLLPTKPTEDASHVLGTIQIAEAESHDGEREYLPNPAVEWIIDIRFEGVTSLNSQRISDAFDDDWIKRLGGFTAYGRDVRTKRWTFLISSDGPETVDQLKLGYDFINVVDENAPVADRRTYEARIAEVQERFKIFGMPTVSVSLEPSEAEERSRLLKKLKNELDMTVVVVLKAPPGKKYDGKAIWDVMLCLGLEWGDMDCFHWRNTSGQGDDSFFSVETTSAPGYFLPEEIVANQLHVRDLVFEFSVPRCVKPVEVFDAMLRAVEYCRKRLGGKIVGEDGERIAPADLRESISDVVNRLRDGGFESGSESALRLF